MIDRTDFVCVNTFNYLGIIIDTYLDQQDHVNSIANKISKYIGILNRNIFIAGCIFFIFNSLNYWILVWGYNTERLDKLKKTDC